MSTQLQDITAGTDATADFGARPLASPPAAAAPASGASVGVTAAPTGGASTGVAAGKGQAAGETRTYRARNVEELIPKIQAELGPDAIVIRRQKGLTGGVGGFFQRPFVEVEARAGAPRVDCYDEADAAPALPPALEPADTADTAEAAVEEVFRELTPASLLAAAVPAPAAEPQADPFAAALAEAQARMPDTEAQAHLPDIEAQAHLPHAEVFADPAPAVAHTATTVAPAPVEPATAVPSSPVAAPGTSAAPVVPRGRARQRVEESLLGYGMSEALVAELIETAATHLLPVMPARTSLARAVHRALCQRIPAGAMLPTTGAAVALAGPGGSGKSACCTALVDAYRARGALPAACATLTPGQAREELLATLAPQLPQPLPLAAPELTRALRAARAEGLLLLDLPALSPADRGAIRAQAALLATLKPDRVILALPATLGAKAAAQLLQALAPLQASTLAITHADETDQLGVAVEAACRFGLAPEYLLDRGRGRTALTQIDPAYLADRLLP